jgi:hypothetical protein
MKILSRSRFWSRAGSHAREPAAWEPPLLGIRDLLILAICSSLDLQKCTMSDCR